MSNSSKVLAWLDRVIAATGLVAGFIFKNDDGSINKDYLLIFVLIAFIFFLSSLYETGSESERKIIRTLCFVLLIPAVVVGLVYFAFDPFNNNGESAFFIFSFMFPIIYWSVAGFTFAVTQELFD